MKLAHVRERHAPAGSAWRLAAAVPGASERHWLDLEAARRRLVHADPALAHNEPLFRRPIGTLDEVIGAGIRVARLEALLPAAVEFDEDEFLHAADLRFVLGQ